MDIKILLGIVLLMVFIAAVILVVNRKGSSYDSKEEVIVFSPDGTKKTQKVQKKEKPSSQFGRFKITLLDGTQKTVVGNLKTILNVNDVKGYHEIK